MADLTMLDVSAPQPLFLNASLNESQFIMPVLKKRRTLPPLTRRVSVDMSTSAMIPNLSSSQAIERPKAHKRRRSSLGDIELPSASKGKGKQRAEREESETMSERLFPPPRPVSAPPSPVPARFKQTYLPHPITGASIREIVRPPPPLLRPKPFWRRTRGSGVTSHIYWPSAHLIRRSTFIAAGLNLDSPDHDLSAFCVECRIGSVVLQPDYIL